MFWVSTIKSNASRGCRFIRKGAEPCFSGMDAVYKHKARLRANLPENGSIRALVITEKQYESIEIMLGALTEADDSFQCEQLSIF